MTEATLQAKVTADIADFTKKFDQLHASIDKLGAGAGGSQTVRATEAMAGKFSQLGDTISGVALSMTKVLTPLAAPLLAMGAAATTSAIDFESAFAGVKKTVDATDAEFKAMELGFRGLAKEIPVAVGELSKIGETAGALGIAKDSILDFTKVIAQMTTTTNLSSEAAANAFARIGSIMGVASGDFQRLGSTVVDLGNKGSSTETEIVGMALRLAGAAKTVGFSTAELLGFSAALSNVGIQAEMGGTAMSTLLVKIAATASAGGEKLDAFAQVAGLTGEQFQRAFKDNAANAVATFIQGLGRMQASGADLFGTLDELGIKQTRMRDTLLRLAATTDAFSGTLATGRSAWEQNSALATEAGKRYATVQSQLDLLHNRAADVALSIGAGVLPALVKLLEASQPLVSVLSSVADAFARLDPSTQTLIVGATALVATIGPVLIVLGSMVSAAGALVPAFSAVAAGLAALPGLLTAVGTGFTGLTTIMAANPFVAVGIAVVALATLVAVNWGTIKSVTVQLVSSLSDWLGAKLTAVLQKVKAPIDAVAGYFRSLYDAVVGRSYVPDMVDEIETTMDSLSGPAMVDIARDAVAETNAAFAGLKGPVIGAPPAPPAPVAADPVGDIDRQVQSLDLTMTSAHRAATAATVKSIETGKFTFIEAQNEMAGVAVQTWGSITNTVSSSFAQQLLSGNNWQSTLDQLGKTVLSNFINLGLQMATQWLISEVTRTAATATGEAARTGIVTASAATQASANVAAATTSAGAWAVAGAAMTAAFTGAMAAIKFVVLGLARAVVGVIGLVVSGVSVVLNSVSTVIGFMLATIGKMLIELGTALQSIPIIGNIIGAILIAAGAGSIALGVALPAIVAGLTGALSAGVGALSAAIPAFAGGGAVFGPTLALVGENASRSNPEFIGHANQLGLAGGRSLTVILEVDREEMARMIAPALVHEVRMRLGAIA